MDDINNKNILNKTISDEVRESFLNYSMSVIVSRALPDLRDGLKPVHRRILFSMYKLNNFHNKQYKKSARIVGDVIGKYHPHGDTSVYDAIVRLAQDFNLRYPLVDGHGNFGSIDGDKAAAMRYTEIRMQKIASEMLSFIESNTVKFVNNYDETEEEPAVLPSLLPNILLNGSSGIAVGLATNIPPHNINNVIDAVLLLLENEDTDIEDLIWTIKGPDFPTGGYISNPEKIKNIYKNGHGSITIDSKVSLDEDTRTILVSEIPYQVNKARLIEKLVRTIHENKIDGLKAINNVKDESNYEGIRIRITYKKGNHGELILQNLLKHTSLRVNFACNFVALVDGEPKTLNLKFLLQKFIEFQIEILVKKTKFDLRNAEKKLHIRQGLIKAILNIDEVIKIIRSSKSNADAQHRLIEFLTITEVQAKAILEMKLSALTSLETEKLELEIEKWKNFIVKCMDVLENKSTRIKIIKDNLSNIKEVYGDERRSTIIDSNLEIEDESLIKKEDIVVLLTQDNYIKRIPASEYKIQNRGGVGSKTTNFYEENDYIKNIVFGSTHDDYMFFTEEGKVFKIKGYNIFQKTKQSKGVALTNILRSWPKNDNIKFILNVKKDEYTEDLSLAFLTKQGIIKKTKLTEYSRINNNGKIAISLKKNEKGKQIDEIVNIIKVRNDTSCIICTSNGKALRIDLNKIRNLSRKALGVKAIKLINDSFVVSATNDYEKEYLLAVTKFGMGKLNIIQDAFSIKGRATQGYNILPRGTNDKVIFAKCVNKTDELLITTKKGITIRISIEQLSVTKTKTSKGVILIKNLHESGPVVTATLIESESEEQPINDTY